MKFFKNKFFIIVLALAVFITVMTLTLSVMGITDPIKDAVNTAAMPFRYVSKLAEESINGFKRYFNTIDRLDKENGELRDIIDDLEDQLVNAEAIKEENERLKSYLEIKETYPDYKLEEALIIGNEADNYTSVITLNKGSDHGIEVGMPVIVKDGLVGSVCETGSKWCRVRIITESTASVGVYVSRSGEIGVLEGDVSLMNAGECYLRYLSPDSDVQAGDKIYTSGHGSVYPGELYVGEVISVETDEKLRTKTAKVRLAVDLENMKYLLIVTDHDKTASE